MESKLIETMEQSITVTGKVLYSDKKRRIHIKRPIRDLFEKNQNAVGYIMELCLTEESVLLRVKELKEKNVQPILLYFTECDAK